MNQYYFLKFPFPFTFHGSLGYLLFLLWFIVCGILRNMLHMFSVQFSSVTQSCLTLCDPMDCSTPVFPVQHQLLELAQTHVHRVADAILPSHPLSSPSPPAFRFGKCRWADLSYLHKAQRWNPNYSSTHYHHFGNQSPRSWCVSWVFRLGPTQSRLWIFFLLKLYFYEAGFWLSKKSWFYTFLRPFFLGYWLWFYNLGET